MAYALRAFRTSADNSGIAAKEFGGLAEVGLHRPALTGVDMNLYGSPARRMKLGEELKARREKLEQGARS